MIGIFLLRTNEMSDWLTTTARVVKIFRIFDS